MIEEATLKLDSMEKPSNFEENSGNFSTSLNSLKSENPNLNFEAHRFSTPQSKLYGKKQISLKKTKCFDDSSNNSKTCHLKYKSNYRKYTTLKESNSKYIGKHSFKRGLQKETSRRHEGDRASRIANSRRYGNNCQSRNDVWMEGVWTKKGKEQNAPLLECSKENLKDFWNFTNKSNCFGDDQNKLEDVKGKKVKYNTIFH